MPQSNCAHCRLCTSPGRITEAGCWVAAVAGAALWHFQGNAAKYPHFFNHHWPPHPGGHQEVRRGEKGSVSNQDPFAWIRIGLFSLIPYLDPQKTPNHIK